MFDVCPIEIRLILAAYAEDKGDGKKRAIEKRD
jgi:hypothetical protein